MAWLSRSSFLGLSRLGNGADLSHQAKLVLYVPRLGDLAPLYAVDGDAREFHLIAGRRDAHIVPLMGGAAPPASNHLVPLGYYVLNGAYHIREASAEKCAAWCLAAWACPAAKSSSAASRSPVWFQSSACSLRTNALFSSTDTFVSSFPVRYPLADHNTPSMMPLLDILCVLALCHYRDPRGGRGGSGSLKRAISPASGSRSVADRGTGRCRRGPAPGRGSPRRS